MFAIVLIIIIYIQPLLEIMSDWLKLVECKYSPSQLFTIFDYTKLVYPIDGGFYLKQIVTPEQRPSFIEIKHDIDKIIAVYSTLNNIIALQSKGEYFYVCFYAATAQQIRVRVPIHLEGSNFTFKSFCSQNMLMICCTASDLVSHQIFFVDCVQKILFAKGFTEGQIFDMSLGPNCSISLYMNKHIVAFKNQPLLERQTMVRIYKEAEADISVECQKHFWIEDQLIVWGKNKVYLIIKNKICQQFTDFHRLHSAAPLVCGFLACDGCVIKIFKKRNIRYELICEIIDENLMQCKNITLSPQQDIFIYYTPVTETLIVSTTFSQQIEEALQRQNSLQLALTLKSREVSHQKSYDYTIYTSSQSWFAEVYGTQIKLINSYNYQKYMVIQLANEGETTFTTADLKPRYLSIHPNRPIFAVALKKSIRIYYVTFNQIKILKQLQISMCGYLLFNHNGSILTVVVAGKGGAKLYIYKINQFKSEVLLLETITIGKKPIAVEWDSLDTCLYCFHAAGYFTFTLESKFKDRKQITVDMNFSPNGVILSKQDSPIFWGGQNLLLIGENQTNLTQTIKDTEIKGIFLQSQYYFMVFENGKIGRSKTLDIETCYIKSFDMGTKGKKFQIRLQEGNKFIYISEDLNAKFYQFGSSYNGFTDIIGVEKKKLYSIMTKHKQYQMQIKKLKQQFATVILEFKAKSAAQQRKIQSEYNFELKDHVERQKKVKQEKAKLEQIMEQTIQVKEKQSMKQIKQLERLYQRKIALTTNKLLTQKQIGFRDKLTAENNLKSLEHRFEQQVELIRQKFSEDLKHQVLDRNQAQKQINSIKKHYETRLYELQEENQILLKGLQQKNQNSLISLKKMINNWENKYSECVSQKDNLQKQYQEQVLNCDLLKQKITFLQVRRIESERRCQNLSNQIIKIEKVLEDRNKIMQFYEKRIQDLEKSNQIMKYRVLEVKQQNDPYESQISKLKQNLTDLQEEYEKILKSSHDQEQKMQILKKQKVKLKQDLDASTQKFAKLSKRHEQLLDKVRETTKSPIQQIRRQLLSIIDSYARVNKSYSTIQKRADSPLGQLNRIRDHLEVCLDEAITTNKKNDEQRKIEVTKKNRQNSELIIQINTMRKKIRELEDLIKDKNLQISRLVRGQTPMISTKQEKQKIETTQAQSKQFMKTRSRQTFYEKSMFRSGNHWNKRLKTEENGGRRKKSSLSMMRDRQHNSLAIHPQAEQIEQYKRIIEQKDIFIQKLIAKIQKN